MRPNLLIVLLLAIWITAGLGIHWMARWTYDAFHPVPHVYSPEDIPRAFHAIEMAQRKPWVPFARLMLTTILGTGMLVTGVYVSLRLGTLLTGRQ